MKPLIANITIDQPAAVTRALIHDVEHWENLARSMDFEVERQPHTPPLSAGQSWVVTGAFGKMNTSIPLTLAPEAEGREIGMTTETFGISAAFDIEVQDRGETSDVTLEVTLKATTLPARALLAPLKWKREKLERKLGKLARRYLSAQAHSTV